MSPVAKTTKSRAKVSAPDPVLPPRKRRPEALTTREQEILERIEELLRQLPVMIRPRHRQKSLRFIRGRIKPFTVFKNKEIAQRLKISVKTVEAHRANMMKKIRVSNTAQLLKAAIQGKMLKLR